MAIAAHTHHSPVNSHTTAHPIAHTRLLPAASTPSTTRGRSMRVATTADALVRDVTPHALMPVDASYASASVATIVFGVVVVIVVVFEIVEDGEVELV